MLWMLCFLQHGTTELREAGDCVKLWWISHDNYHIHHSRWMMLQTLYFLSLKGYTTPNIYPMIFLLYLLSWMIWSLLTSTCRFLKTTYTSHIRVSDKVWLTVEATKRGRAGRERPRPFFVPCKYEWKKVDLKGLNLGQYLTKSWNQTFSLKI